MLFHPDEVDGRRRPRSVELVGCIFLARRGVRTAGDGLQPLAAAQTTLALLPYSNLVRRMDAGSVIPRLAELARRVPAYDCPRGPLHRMVTAVERVLDGTV